MLVSFQLTMPNKGSWNGQWTGEGRPYFIVRNISKSFFDKQEHFKTLAEKKRDSWYYSWSDGWGASVIAEIVSAGEAAKRRKASAGFCGYDWMVTSIVNYGEITTETERRKSVEINGTQVTVMEVG